MLDLLALLALSLVGPATQAGSPRVICIQKSHKQRLTMVHLCASQRPHVGLNLFEDCFWVASTSTVVGRIWWQLTSRKGWVNGETIMCSKCCPCPPCALVGWVHDGHVSGSGNIFAFGAGWVGHAMMQIGHWYHQCILNIKQRNITVPLSLTLEWILWRWLTGWWFHLLVLSPSWYFKELETKIHMTKHGWCQKVTFPVMDAIIPPLLGLDQRTCCRAGLLWDR